MPTLALNEDSSHFFYTRAGQPLTEATVDAMVDQYAGTQVSHLLFNPNCMRTSYASRVWEPIWRGYDPQGPNGQPLLACLPPESQASVRKWIHTAWALDRAGIDVYGRWIARARRHGISPWLSMRMNDVHFAGSEQAFSHSDLWRAHPEFRRIRYHLVEEPDRALDYGRVEVREHHFRLIEELAERYDFDGLELDWMRHGFHLRPGYEAEGAELLTAFTDRVRRLLDSCEQERGHRIRLGARVPSRPQAALDLGMDAVTWARRRLIDWLVFTPFCASIETDMPVETWRNLLSGTEVELCAGLEANVKPYPASPLWEPFSLAVVRAAALSLLSRGADRIYFFNYMDSLAAMGDRDSDYRRLLCVIGDPAAMAEHARRHLVTYADTWAVGEPRAMALPVSMGSGGWHAFRVHIGPRPTTGNASVVLAFDPAGGGSGEAVSLRVNGEVCGAAETVVPPKPRPVEPAWRYAVALAVLRDGFNVIEINAQSALTVTWVELDITGPP